MKKTILGVFCFSLLVMVLIMGTSISALVPASAIVSDLNKEITIYIGESATFDIGKPVSEIIWRSEDDAIARVDDSGLITPVSVGTTSIIATYKKIDYYCKVNVLKAYLSQTEIEVFPFEWFELSVVGTNIKKWKIKDDTIVSLPTYVPTSNTFRLKALAEGETLLTITGKNKKKYKCRIVVKPCTYKASYYDKKKKKIKNISYYVDGKLVQYDSYNEYLVLDYSIKYFYQEDKYIEYQEGPKGLITQTIYDYNDNVIGETFDQSNVLIKDYNQPNHSSWYFEKDSYYKYAEDDLDASKTFYDYNDNLIREIKYFNDNTPEDPAYNIRSEKYVDENGYWHSLEYYNRYVESENSIVSLVYRESVYDKDMQRIGYTEYDRKTGEKKREYTYFPEDGNLASDVSYVRNIIYHAVYYNQSPYFKNREIDGSKEIFYDFSGRVVRIITHDENNNIISDLLY